MQTQDLWWGLSMRRRKRWQKQPRLAHRPQKQPPCILNASGWCRPASQGQCALIKAADGQTAPRKAGTLLDSDVIVNVREQTDGGLRQMEAPEGGDIPRGVSLWASVSLYAQWEQKEKGVHPPRATHVAASDPWPQGGTEGRTEGGPVGRRSRSPGRSPTPLSPHFCDPQGWKQHPLYKFALRTIGANAQGAASQGLAHTSA